MKNPPLISVDSRRVEPPADKDHYHVWLDRGFVLIAQEPRFPSRSAARSAALRVGHELGTFVVLKCQLPCRFTIPRKRQRKTRRCCKCGGRK